MNYEILKGQEINLDGTSMLVETIDVERDMLGRLTFKINGAGSYSKFDIGMQVTLVENKFNQTKNKFKLFKKHIGLFFRRSIETGVLLGDSFGIRKFGFHFCSIYCSFTILERKFHFEFVWRDKDEFTGARMPEFNPLRQVF